MSENVYVRELLAHGLCLQARFKLQKQTGEKKGDVWTNKKSSKDGHLFRISFAII